MHPQSHVAATSTMWTDPLRFACCSGLVGSSSATSPTCSPLGWLGRDVNKDGHITQTLP